jgi:hypothetical protein
MAGILATYLTAKYSTKNNLRVVEIERHHRARQEAITERKSVCVKMLHSFEEFICPMCDLELIAPMDIIKACRLTLKSLREQTCNLTNYGDFSTEPYNSLLAMTVARMGLDLDETLAYSAVSFFEDVERGMKDVHGLNAPESAIRLRLDENDSRARSTPQPSPAN